MNTNYEKHMQVNHYIHNARCDTGFSHDHRKVEKPAFFGANQKRTLPKGRASVFGSSRALLIPAQTFGWGIRFHMSPVFRVSKWIKCQPIFIRWEKNGIGFKKLDANIAFFFYFFDKKKKRRRTAPISSQTFL